MAVLVTNMSGHIQNQLTRSLERILEDAHLSGELKLSGRKLKDFPKPPSKFTLSDTVIADLSKNKFSELPEEVTGFPFLERLHLYHNAIRSIPDTVCSLQSLSFIDLSRNQLTTLPREICQLPLQILLVSNNRLSSLPDELGRMSQLTELDASCNQLTHLPPRMGDLPMLQSLLLRNNFLLCVPVEITYLRLVRLDLRANRISMLPIEMREMNSLIELMVDDNPLTSPPASLCKRGRVHIFKYLEIEAIKLDRKGIGGGASGGGGGTLGRRPRKSNSGTPGPTSAPSHLPERLKHKRHNVDSGYSTSDGFDKRWSQEIQGDAEAKLWNRSESTPASSRSSELNGTHSGLSTPSTISPGPDQVLDDDTLKVFNDSYKDELQVSKELSSARLSPCSDPVTNGNGIEEKSRPYQHIQTYREFKEALKQQRAQDSHSVYRTRDPEDQSYKTEPNTPTHTSSSSLTRTTLATSKSDPTPLNSALSSPKHIFDDTSPKRPVQKVPPSRNNYQSSNPPSPILNGNSAECNGKNGTTKYIQDYIKPNSPVKYNTGILSHDNVPPIIGSPRHSSTPGYANGASNGTTKTNGIKTTNRTISWNQDVTPDKLSFTMRREFDKAREESDLIDQLRQIIETRLKMALPQDLAPALTDGVVLCHLANHVRPRSVGSIHVPSPAVPKLTMARCRRNVDNFLDACRRIGVEEGRLCSSVDVTEALAGRGLPRLLDTVFALSALESPPKQHTQGPKDATVSLLLLSLFLTTVALLFFFPLPD